MPPPNGASRNHILGALPKEDFKRFEKSLEAVELPLGWAVHEADLPMKFLYFPISGIVSMLHVMANGASGEIAVVGNEGAVGISLFMGSKTMMNRAIVQSAGQAYRMPATVLDVEFRRGGPLQDYLLRYTQALITQMSQTAVCNRHHTVVQQLCRWLLLSLDRVATNQLIMTQELIANMLGVRRVGVTEAAAALQKEGLIKYTRGKITILNRTRLEARACECYAVVKKETDRLLPLSRH